MLDSLVTIIFTFKSCDGMNSNEVLNDGTGCSMVAGNCGFSFFSVLDVRKLSLQLDSMLLARPQGALLVLQCCMLRKTNLLACFLSLL